MKPSKRNLAKQRTEAERLADGPPKVSKYAAKRRPVVEAGQGQARTVAPHGVTQDRQS